MFSAIARSNLAVYSSSIKGEMSLASSVFLFRIALRDLIFSQKRDSWLSNHPALSDGRCKRLSRKRVRGDRERTWLLPVSPVSRARQQAFCGIPGVFILGWPFQDDLNSNWSRPRRIEAALLVLTRNPKFDSINTMPYLPVLP